MKKILFTLLISLIAVAASAQSRRSAAAAPAVPLPSEPTMVTKAKAGDAFAQAFIGRCYYWGEYDVEENDPEAVKWFKKAALNGSPYGKFWLGLCYKNGYGVPQNATKGQSYIDESVAQVSRLAENGDVNAIFFMGEIYQFGPSENLRTAISWYEKAGEQGFELGFNEAAKCYKREEGSNSVGAFNIYKKAAELGMVREQFELGRYYMNGDVVPKNEQEGARWWLASAEGGYNYGQMWIADCYETGRGVDKDLSQAIHWYTKAADQGIYGALYNLGCYYRDGYGVDRDYDKALHYLTAASKKGDDAKYDLQELKSKGRAFYANMPLRCPEDFYELKPDDPFANCVLSDNWSQLPEEIKNRYRKHFKKEKIREWGVDRATKVVQHLVEIGFTSEQLQYSQGSNYRVRVINAPNATIRIMEYDHCTYYLADDVLFGMVWANGLQVGDVKLIETYRGDAVITTGNR